MIFDVLEGIEGHLISELLRYCSNTFPDEISSLTNVMAEKTRDYWQQEALARSAWGSKYAQAIKIEYASVGGIAKVYVDGKNKDPRSNKPFALFVNMTESGVGTFDIKKGLLGSDKARMTNHGVKYIIVPFRFRVPGKQKAASGFSGVMPKDIYQHVKSGKTYKDNGLRGKKFANMSGLKKYDKAAGGHGQYFTFRMVTEKSEGWIYPGKAPTPVYPKVLKRVQAVIEQHLDNYIRSKLNAIQRDFS